MVPIQLITPNNVVIIEIKANTAVVIDNATNAVGFPFCHSLFCFTSDMTISTMAPILQTVALKSKRLIENSGIMAAVPRQRPRSIST